MYDALTYQIMLEEIDKNAKEKGIIGSVHQFFEDLFRICRDEDSLHQISNALGMDKAKQVSMDLLLKKLPLGLEIIFTQEKYFCVKNMKR